MNGMAARERTQGGAPALLRHSSPGAQLPSSVPLPTQSESPRGREGGREENLPLEMRPVGCLSEGAVCCLRGCGVNEWVEGCSPPQLRKSRDICEPLATR